MNFKSDLGSTTNCILIAMIIMNLITLKAAAMHALFFTKLASSL
jgi:hypothetical protein